jgi:eukaryotic-like serine/threonine-protein kinase
VPILSDEFIALQQVVAGRYSIERELGRGGMGVVFLARDVALDRPVAIKLLVPALAASQGARARFLREARAAARLAHPHIVPVHAVEEHEDLVFFVMAYVDGETLGERVRRAGPLTSSEALRVTQEVAWALAHAHSNGVIHRDVKPDNILLERASGRALVTDFGIAHMQGGTNTPDGHRAFGTPHYMSPEQGAGSAGDERSDIYALGVTAFYASSGRLPFEGRTVPALLVQHATVAPPPLLAERPTLPPRFAAAIDRCLDKDPASRWESAEQLARAVADARGALTHAPAPVRAFVGEAMHAGGEIGTALTIAAVALPAAAYYWTTASFFLDLRWVLYGAVALMGGSLGLLRVGQLLQRARELRRIGYDHPSVVPAIRSVESDRVEERESATALAKGTSRSRNRERWLLGGAAVVKTAAGFWLVGADVPTALGAVGFAVSIVVPTMAIRSFWKDWKRASGLWPSLLKGKAGRLGFRIAGIGIGSGESQPVEGEGTIAVLGRAAEDAFEALPKEQRARLGDVPAVVARLREDAERLRERQDQPAAAERLASTVAALEGLRLDLIKLTAGMGSLDELTRDIEAAKQIGERVDAELEVAYLASGTTPAAERDV